MQNNYRSIRRYLDVLEQAVTSFALISILALIVINVVLRYIFHSGIFWGEEIARVLFIGMTYMAISRVDAANIHFHVSFLEDHAPKYKFLLNSVVNLVQLGLLSYLGLLSFQLAGDVRDMGQHLPASQLPAYWFYLPVTVGLILGAFRSLEKFVASCFAHGRQE